MTTNIIPFRGRTVASARQAMLIIDIVSGINRV